MTAEKRQIGYGGSGEEVAHVAPGQRGCAPRQTARTATLPSAEPTPIWLAALMAKGCQIVGGSQDLAISWKHTSGKPLYTNWGLVASWITGDTGCPLETEQ